MGRHLSKFDANEVGERIALGYGQGTGRSYTPWPCSDEIPSSVTGRQFSPQMDDALLSFSDFERLIFEFVATFNDACEQGPIDPKPRELFHHPT